MPASLELVKIALKAYGDGDVEIALALSDPNLRWDERASRPDAELVWGHDDVAKGMRRYRAGWQSYKFELEDIAEVARGQGRRHLPRAGSRRPGRSGGPPLRGPLGGSEGEDRLVVHLPHPEGGRPRRARAGRGRAPAAQAEAGAEAQARAAGGAARAGRGPTEEQRRAAKARARLQRQKAAS